MAAELETAVLDNVRAHLARWRIEFADRPDAEREHLLLLSLEREQIVAVAYREEAMAARVAELAVDDVTRALFRQTLVWIWKDEQLHAEYMRGELLRAPGLGSSLVVYGRQLQGAVSGWTSATSNHRDPRRAPLRSGAAGVLVAVAGLFNRIPPVLRRELRYQTFQRYCRLNVALELSAELAYRRLVELANSDAERRTFDRIRADEARHAVAFRALAAALTDDDHLAAGATPGQLAAELGAISPWFIPASLRAGERPARRAFASGAPVVVRTGRVDADKAAVLDGCLDAAGLGDSARGARTAAIPVSFMLGYDHRDRSNVNDPELVAALARYLRRHGVEDVAVLEAPTVYENTFANRSVSAVAAYFGFASPSYRGDGRADLDDQADDIAQVSLAAAPFVSRWLGGVIAERRPAAVLDVGCGTGVYSAVVLGADPDTRITAIDLAASVVDAARGRLDDVGYARRAELHVGDVRPWASGQRGRFDVVLLINNIYYFDPASRVALYRDLGRLLTSAGELLVVSMTAPGSIAAAHLHFMLVAQAGINALPTIAAIDADLRAAGFAVTTTDRLVPTEPLVAVRARPER